MTASTSKPAVLVTGGAGYIGSHTCKQLYCEGFEPVVYDNLSTGNRHAVKWGPLIAADVRDTGRLAAALRETRPMAVIHFAASAYVGESVTDPAKYYANNVAGMMSVLDAGREAGIKRIIFSSSCATYGIPQLCPITEASPQNPINPYGRTKLVGEQMLADYAGAYGMNYVALRYFNACGADPEREIGEWHDPETHLIPRALMAAMGSIPALEVFGDDYPTRDGTCVRDYVHVSDLAEAHVQAVKYLAAGGQDRCLNIGTGHGHSIREVLAAISRVTGRPVPVVMKPRRPGDPPELVADPSLARRILGFSARHSGLDTIVRTAAPFFELRAAS
jgi:UDP-arabinose 4-epimerase